MVASLLGAPSVARATARPADQQSIEAFEETLRRVQDRYVDNVDIEHLSETALKAAASQLDRYSEYLSPAEYHELLEDTEGHFVGIGVSVERSGEKTIVLSVIPQSPAARAGIAAGDEIISVEGRLVRTLTLAQASQMIRGNPGSTLTVFVQRAGWEAPKAFRLVRAMVEVNPVSSVWLPEAIVYVRIDRFSEDVASRLKNIVESVENRAQGLVIDLRNDGGGLFTEALDLSDLFLKQGIIVTTRGKQGALLKHYTANRRSSGDGLSIVVLVNENTASAAEIVSVALKENQRATLVGSKTFGKGSVQEVMELPNGGALKLTVARYYSPLGQSIDHQGVTPNVVVAEDPSRVATNTANPAALADDPAIQKALELFAKRAPANSSAATSRK